MRRLLLHLLLFASSSLLFFFLLEVGIRAKHSLQGVPFFTSLSDFNDPELGWVGKYSPGAKDSQKPRILFLGDSFTDGLGVEESKLYYRIAAENLGAEAFAYGGRGYGSLQEYLVLKRLLPEVRPQLIVLQMCVNDFLNNSWELESQSYLQNALLPRPYLQENGSIALLFPRPFPKLRSFLDVHSRLAHVFLTRLEMRNNQRAQQKQIQTIEHRIEQSRKMLPEAERAVKTTAHILQLIQESSGQIRVVAFLADEIPPWAKWMQTITKERNIPLLPQVSAQIMKAEQAKRVVRMQDNVHWNAEGHAIVGETLAEALVPHLWPAGKSTGN